MTESTKKCPFCAETILAEAIKCKHCGEKLAAPQANVPADALPKQPTKSGVVAEAIGRHRKVLVFGLVAVLLLGAGALGRRLVTNSDWWVGTHSDVLWHRAWQNDHMKSQATRVAELYAKLAEKHPGEPEWEYLRIRALPAGAVQAKEWAAAVQKFPKSPWLAWGQASTTMYLSDLKTAGELFGDSMPDDVLPHFVDAAAESGGDDLNFAPLVAPYVKRCSASSSCASAMADAEFRLGSWRSAQKWDLLAARLGATREPSTKKQVEIMKTIGFSNGAMHSSEGLGPTYRPLLRLVNARAYEGTSGYGLLLTFEFEAGSEEVGVSILSFDLQTSSGVAEKGDEDGSTFPMITVAPSKTVTHRFLFVVKKGATVEKVIWEPSIALRKITLPLSGDLKDDATEALSPAE